MTFRKVIFLHGSFLVTMRLAVAFATFAIAFLAIATRASAEPGELQVNLHYDDTALALFEQVAKGEDTEARAAAIEKLLADTSYQVLIRNEMPAEVLRDLITAAFDGSPSKYGDLGAAFSRHISEAARDIDTLRGFASDMIEVAPSYSAEVTPLVEPLLPHDTLDTYDIQVGLLVFGYDARAYDRLLVDILFAQKNTEVLSWILAHEVHHDIRNRHVAFDQKACTDERLRKILWSADQIQSEGIADLIDKDMMFSLPVNAELREKYNALLEHVPEIISKLNMHTARGNFNSLEEALPMAGHIVGRHVAETLKAEIILDPALVLQPSVLFKAFNKKSPPEIRFSANYIELVEQAENECR